ncbi:hypothetical protein CHU32_13810 [Superficieibacter electus]|uniref:Uncharacterized protein n=1 Tax=Superficieibacter electus TaxID=2022662 RepID=A0A2P5GP67_9ENTR|nr:hypothetical protein [Superficieibacter electus]POP44952.1 hypothetical protein CHU33_10885 [Superficieibacter electus]POP48339.1 hypothetical protein CHU32_13810 [Superficieibacter electus]
MSDITLQKAATKAYQAEIVARMLENYPHKMTDSEVESVASILVDLISPVAAYLIEEESKNPA